MKSYGLLFVRMQGKGNRPETTLCGKKSCSLNSDAFQAHIFGWKRIYFCIV